jgi:hypothetical protein
MRIISDALRYRSKGTRHARNIAPGRRTERVGRSGAGYRMFMAANYAADPGPRVIGDD